MTDKTLYTPNALSDTACFALCYAQALIAGPTSQQAAAFAAIIREMDIAGQPSPADRRRALAKGLAELTERGIIDCKRDGEGALVPVTLHTEKLRPDAISSRRIITGDMN